MQCNAFYQSLFTPKFDGFSQFTIVGSSHVVSHFANYFLDVHLWYETERKITNCEVYYISWVRKITNCEVCYELY